MKLNTQIFIFLVFSCFYTGNVLAQNSLADSLSKRIDSLLMTYVANEVYDQAYEIAEEYKQYTNFESKPDFWLHYGLACNGLVFNIRGLYETDTSTIFKAYNAFDKAEYLYRNQLDSEEIRAKMSDSLQKCKTRLHDIIINEMSSNYRQIKDGEIKDSLVYLNMLDYAYRASRLAEKINPVDTMNYFYSTKFSLLKGDYESYREDKLKWIRLIPNKNSKYKAYGDLISVYQDSVRNNEATLYVLEKALVEFPQDSIFNRHKLAISDELNDSNKALEAARSRIANDPSNPRNYFNLGLVYQKMGRMKEAVEAYKQCLKIQPNDYNAQFYLGALHFNKGVSILQSIQDMTYTEYHKKHKAIESRANVEFEQAREYFERLRQSAPNDEKILKSLQRIYQFLKLDEELKEVSRILDK